MYSDWSSILPLAAKHLQDADATIVTSYCPDAIAAADATLDSRVPMRVFYDLDTPVTLDRLCKAGEVPYIKPEGLGGFDLVLSYTGGLALTDPAGNRVLVRPA